MVGCRTFCSAWQGVQVIRALVLFFLLVTSAHAAQVDIDLLNVKLRDLVRVVYGDILHKSFVLDTTFIQNEDALSVTLRNRSRASIELELQGIIKAHGFSLQEKDGVVHVNKLQADNDSEAFFYYRPKYRSVSYLLALTAQAFPHGEFLNARKEAGINLGQVSGTMGQGVPVPVTVASQGVNSIADNDMDVIVFRGSDKDVDRLQAALSQLDVAAGEVLIKAVVYEVQDSKSDASAVDLALNLIRGRIGINQSLGAASSQSSFFLKSNALSAVFSMFAQDSRFKLMTSPRIRVKSGASARFSVGDEVPVLGQISVSSTGQPIQSVDYKSSGVIFSVTPQVRGDSIDLTVDQQISSFVQTTTGVNNSPTLTKRALSSDVQLHDGELVVLGGLDQDNDASSHSQVPFLPSFLGSNSSSKQHTEIVLLLHVQRI
jgi:general secretion pathway protein D